VAVHGVPRYTGDIDFFVAIDERNAAKLLETFEDFGLGDIGIEKGDFLEVKFIVEIGREPRKIQVMTGIDGVEFTECFENRIELEVDGGMVNFISLEDLLKNKIASGRAKDLIDIAELTRLHNED
jgi:predicted nucleotidyltransferase